MSILRKPEAIICPVFVERILNQKNLSENTCFLKDSDTEKMTLGFQENRILFFPNIKPSFLFMDVFGMGMKVVTILCGLRIMRNFGKRK